MDHESTSAYHLTKLEGEDIALEFDGVEVVVVNPSAPVGDLDWKPTVTGRRILDVMNGRWPRQMVGPVNYVCASACVRGMMAAAERGMPRERYLLGGLDELRWDDFLERVAQAAGCAIPKRSLLWRLRGKGLPSPGHLSLDISKARRDLDYDPGDLDQALARAVAWFRAQNS